VADKAKALVGRYGRQGLAAVGIHTGKFTDTALQEWREVNKGNKYTWPVGFDANEKVTKLIYPGEETRYSYCFIDRKGNLRKFALRSLDDVEPLAKKLLDEK
jgi:hypothetical protein